MSLPIVHCVQNSRSHRPNYIYSLGSSLLKTAKWDLRCGLSRNSFLFPASCLSTGLTIKVPTLVPLALAAAYHEETLPGRTFQASKIKGIVQRSCAQSSGTDMVMLRTMQDFSIDDGETDTRAETDK